MVYPVLIGGFALLVLLALVAFLVPVFEKVFKDFGGELPAITKFTVSLSHLVTDQWYLLIGGIVLAIFVFRKWKNSERGTDAVGPLQAAHPVEDRRHRPEDRAGALLAHVLGARSRPACRCSRRSRSPAAPRATRWSRRRWTTCRDSVKKGGTIAAPMREEPRAFPAMVVQMIAVGEETGALETMLSKIADFYEDEVAAAIKALTSILEPLMIIVVGAIVGFIVIAMYLPMFKVYDQIK